jgi:uncharacterized protein YcbK (DUF882 family)
MGDLSKNFSWREFACPCCGLYIKSTKLIDTLQAIRDAIGKAILINSGTRCKEHNKEVGGVADSAHITGEAADIKVVGFTKSSLGEFIKAMHKKGKLPHLRYCYLISNSKTAVHVGVDDKPRKSVFGW